MIFILKHIKQAFKRKTCSNFGLKKQSINQWNLVAIWKQFGTKTLYIYFWPSFFWQFFLLVLKVFVDIFWNYPLFWTVIISKNFGYTSPSAKVWRKCPFSDCCLHFSCRPDIQAGKCIQTFCEFSSIWHGLWNISCLDMRW